MSWTSQLQNVTSMQNLSLYDAIAHVRWWSSCRCRRRFGDDSCRHLTDTTKSHRSVTRRHGQSRTTSRNISTSSPWPEVWLGSADVAVGSPVGLGCSGNTLLARRVREMCAYRLLLRRHLRHNAPRCSAILDLTIQYTIQNDVKFWWPTRYAALSEI